MMRWRLTEIQGRYQQHTGEKLTYEVITAATGLSSRTISGISTGRVTRVDFHTLERLLAFFSTRLGEPLTTNDLLEYRPAEPARIVSRTARVGATTIRPEFTIDPDEL